MTRPTLSKSDIRLRIEARRMNRSKYYPDFLYYIYSRVAKTIEFEFNEHGFILKCPFKIGVDHDLVFHSNWSWIMEAIKFIENLHDKIAYSVKIEGTKCEVFSNTQYAIAYDKHLDIFYRESTKEESTFLAVSDFAKIYNEKKL